MREILKRTAVTLTANQPERIWITGGIDLRFAEITFRYPLFKNEQQIHVKFGDASGRSAEEPVYLPAEGTSLYQIDTSNIFFTPMFSYMEITSPVDMTLEIFAQEGEMSSH